jgi:hypothetical protein
LILQFFLSSILFNKSAPKGQASGPDPTKIFG